MRRIVSAGALFCLGAAALFAQGTTSLRGTVTDQQDAVLVAAKVTLTQQSTGIIRSVLTQKTGEYQFQQVPPGMYSLMVEMPGFAVQKREAVQLLVDTPATINVKLEVASNTSVVTVSEETPQLNTVNASVGNTFQEAQISNLPLQTRNVVELLSLQPGVTQRGEVMGARRDQNTVTLDGVDVNDNQNALSGLNGTDKNVGFNSALPVPLDSVMEFRVTVAGEGANQGRSSGGQVSLVTRSGTNAMHGSLYEFNRNTDYTANTWFNNRSGVPRPQLVRNQFGASLGGPVKKDRLFYFFNYERRIDASQQSVTRTVPSETLKQGLVSVGLNNGMTYQLTPSDIVQIDPLHQGINSSVLNILKQYPVGNTPSLGADQGLNFSGLIFNAPSTLDSRAYVGKFDWVVDSQARHTVSFRGTLSNSNQTYQPEEFPGQSAASELLANNKGFSTRYTAVLTPNIVNVASVGLTRIGLGTTGPVDTRFTLGDLSDPFGNYTTRGNSRANPVWNVADDLTWTKGAHTISTGVNFRFINNNLQTYKNAWPSYGFSRGLLVGLGSDIDAAVLNYIQQGIGNSSLKLANSSAVTNAMGDILGVLDSLSVTYQYQKDGSIVPIGRPSLTDFITRNYEAYVQDTWKAARNLTLTYGVRYSYTTPPYEANGLQVDSTPGLNQLFADRVFAMNNGIPNNALPDARLSYGLNGPVNGKSSWFGSDTNNFAPRFSFAWTPSGEGKTKWLGKNTVVRGGAAMVYDQYGNDLVANYASLGSVGLATSLSFPTSYNFTTGSRFNGSVPALPTAPAGGFPYTPGDISAIAGTLYGISPDLVAPYSYVLNFSVSHQFEHGFTLDLGYVGRLSHKLLMQEDAFSPLIYFKDPKSGTTWVQADTQMRLLYNTGVTPNQVKANPSLVANSQFVDDLFPGLKNYYFPGSASANYFYGIYGEYGGSDLDNLHSLDRIGAPNGCIVVTGCWTFFSPQGSADPTWTNAGNANYHALVVTVRHALSKGFSFDLNYTWSHSIDTSSTPADGTTQFGGVLQNAFVPGQFRGSSDFDMRHQVNANLLYELPIGKGKAFANSVPGWVDEIIGGWQISSLMRFSTGMPTTISGDGVFPTNYWQSALAIPNGAAPESGVGSDQFGNPSIFRSTTATDSYQDEFPGGSGTRAILRMPGMKDVDLAVAKSFKMPWEGHTLSFRAEAFNAFNNVNFNYTNPSTGSSTTNTNLSLSSPGLFGEFTNTAPPRVLQLALRYSF